MSDNDATPESLIKRLAYALYWADESLQMTLQSAGWERMSRTKSMIMLNLIYGVTRPIQLAANLGISRQAVHQILQEMVQESLIELVEDAADRRAKVVVISKKAKNISDDIQRAMTAIEAELAQRIGERSVALLMQALKKDWGPLFAANIAPTSGKSARAKRSHTKAARSRGE